MILKCTCKSKFQDWKYGKGKRVHNRCKDQGYGKRGRCTVCGNERFV